MRFVVHTGVLWRVVESDDVAMISLSARADGEMVCVDVEMRDGSSFKSNWFRSLDKAVAMQARIAEMCGVLVEGGMNSRVVEDQ